MRRLIPTIIAFAWIGACGGEPPAQEAVPDAAAVRAAHADTVEIAIAAFDPAVFDTITWKSTQEAIERGGVVYRSSCQKCHGDGGRGNGNFVQRGDTLFPPSFLTADWHFADDAMGLRQQIFTGNAGGMYHFGLVGLKYRDVDAAARYITQFLRVNYGQK